MKPLGGLGLVQAMRRDPGVQEARIYSQSESEALLRPWLGQGLDLSELPTPRMIVLKLNTENRPDFDRLRIERRLEFCIGFRRLLRELRFDFARVATYARR